MKPKSKFAKKSKNPTPPSPNQILLLKNFIETEEAFHRKLQDISDEAYPPLFDRAPWTQTVFYRDDGDEGKILEVSYRPPKKKPKKKPYGPIGEDGELRYPLPKSKEELAREQAKKEKLAREREKNERKGLVPLMDLLTGEYYKRKEREKRLQLERKLKIEQRRKEREEELKRNEHVPSVLPVNPEEQLSVMRNRIVTECRGLTDEEQINRIAHYIHDRAGDRLVAKYPKNLYEKSVAKISSMIRPSSDDRNIIKSLHNEIIEGFVRSMKEATLRHVLKDPRERKRLSVSRFPLDWSPIAIRAPMPWHTPAVLSKERLLFRYFQGNNIVIELQNLWKSKYESLLIFDLDRMKTELEFPVTCDTFETRLVQQAERCRTVLLNEWICDIADLLVKMRPDWECYAPKKKTDKNYHIEGFLRTVCAVMSVQLRSLVLRSLEHFCGHFAYYKGGNDYGGSYRDFAINKHPLLLIRIEWMEESHKLCFSPGLNDVKDLIHSWLIKIIDTNNDIPRIEKYLFPEFRNDPLYLLRVRKEEKYVTEIIENTLHYFDLNCTGPNSYIITYEPYWFILNETAKEDLLKMWNQEPFPLLQDFTAKIRYFEKLQKEIIFLRRHIPLNMLMLDCSVVNDLMLKIVTDLRLYIVNHFAAANQKHNKEICQVYQSMSQRSSEMPETTAQLVELINYIVECRDVTIYNLKAKSRLTAEYVLFLMDHANLPNEDILLNSRVFVWPLDMETTIDTSLKTLLSKKNMAEETLKSRRQMFEDRLKRHEKELDAFRKLDPPLINMDVLKDYVSRIDDINNKIQDDKQEASNINEEESLLEQDITAFSVLTNMLKSVDPFYKLWHTSLDFHVGYEKWYYGPFVGLNADEVKEIVDEQWKLLRTLGKQLFDYPGAKSAAYLVHARVDKFRLLIPILQAICNEGLQAHHWEMISELVGKPIELRPDSSLADMIDIGIQKDIEQLEKISMGASKEHALLKSLKNMKNDWAGVKFECVLYRETGVAILSSVDDIQLLLDDHILKSQTMRGSPYVKPFEAEMQEWEEKLISMQDILDQWLQVQSIWMYLEPIFSSEDIMRQMPVEARNFKQVDREWRTIMSATSKNPDVLEATNYPNLLPTLKTSNNCLSEIQRGLNDYLEKKRLFFPRFFFLSNDELLEILSETKDPTRVKPHLKKCFEGIYDMEFNDQEQIVGINSSEGEIIKLATPINPEEAKGMVERWLSQLEEQMWISLRDITLESISAYLPENRIDWILEWPGQIIQAVDCVQYTADLSVAIENIKLPEYLQKWNSQIDELVELVQGDLELAHRITVEALIVIDVHGRDIIQFLIKSNTHKTVEFNWISQFRYYWRDNTLICSMITTDIDYGFEYLGNTGRLVATPLTDRCFRTLMGAFKLNLGGAPEGPAGTGKTETCKDLAKAVAKKCVVFNCSDQMDYKGLGKFFKGLAQSGAWACFDEFNRIELEVLSVVAQQILSIQMAIIKKEKRFNFEGTDLSLNPTCNIFITMNPGYAGRQELPDNLKVLFRTVAMMVPDYGLIGEITLYSNGFVNAGPLAEKIVQVYKLCSEQLSSQNHYDYGMRAVKSVLIAAGALKKSFPTQNESELMLRAIIDINLPKFLSQDVLLFEGIYKDLFPGVTLPDPARDELKNHIAYHLEQKNLQNTPWYMEKILQIYEMIRIRHGLMIIGEAMTGKTNAYQVLAKALYSLQIQKPAPTHKENGAIYQIINPKAITMDQLYGYVDSASNEWCDGILSNVFRKFANSTTKERKWILFDGPVDAVWIENLNTVLDDNKKLCLTSGEIIQMTKSMNLIFEPADLEFASPATISRCGMIYFELAGLGWRPFYHSFLKDITNEITPELLELAKELIEWLMDPVLNFVNKKCEQFIETNELHLFYSFRRIFCSFIFGETQISTIWYQYVIVFSILWGVCSTLRAESRKQFDVFYRKLLDGGVEEYPKPKSFKLTKSQLFTEKNTVFDYYCDKKNGGMWIPWLDLKKDVSIPPNAKVTEILITTTENSYLSFFVDFLLLKNIPILLLGPTGTGKSSVARNYLLSLPRNKFITNTINFSARTSANQTQEIIMSKLDRRRKGVFGPAMGKQCILFVDDLSMPQKEKYDAQPPIELLRQWIDHGHLYELKGSAKQELVDMKFLASMLPPGGGSNKVTKRLIRHMHILSVDSFEDSTLQKIFGAIAEWHFGKGFVEAVTSFSRNVITATLEVYKSAIKTFLPTPLKSHYTFNLRDFSKVIRGILLVPSTHLKTKEKLITLWIHEIYRVYYDRLVDERDRSTLFDIVNTTVNKNFSVNLNTIMENYVPKGEKLEHEHLQNIFFGNYMEPDADPKVYDQVASIELMSEKMEYYLKEYNLTHSTPMELVMCKYVLEHVSRACRVLLQDDGHLLLVGVGGSGGKSTVKLAASILDMKCFQIQISRAYGQSEWWEDLRKILMTAGIVGKPIVFMFSDSQIKYEGMVEDLNMIINSGDIPNLYPVESKAEIIEKMLGVAREIGQTDTTPFALFNLYVERVKSYLHIAFSMSPIGDAFRNRIRMFPSLVNNSTIDWFLPWNKEALEKVAYMYLKTMGIDSEKTLYSCIQLCQFFHSSVEKYNVRFEQEQRRKNYITPTTYSELIKMFQILYKMKVDQITLARNRYLSGLDQLQFAAGQVTEMQTQLTNMHPQLVEMSEATEKLMIKIEQDTVVVEAQKEIVGADEALANEAAAAAQAIKDDCESDLAEAVPALNEAVKALNTLKPAEITLVKSMKNPPSGVKLVMEAICVMKGVKPDRRMTAEGFAIEDYWGPSLKLLGDLKFLVSLQTYDKDNVDPAIMKKIREKFITDRDFNPEVIHKVSTACEGLCKWVRAIEVYDRVIKVVAPKKLALAEAEAELQAQMFTLNQKRAELQGVLDKLQTLNDEFAEYTRKKKGLEDDIDLCTQKLDRAEKLIGGLGGEKSRWSELANQLQNSLTNIIGDALLSAGFIVYLGVFTMSFRNELIKLWNEKCIEFGISCSPKFSLITTLGEPVVIREWNIAGLPVDNYSIENGIIVHKARRWPLMIDPQAQANKWLKAMEKKNEIMTLKFSDSNYLKSLETAIQIGKPVILENVLETLEPVLEPLLQMNYIHTGGTTSIQLTDSVIDMDPNFRFYITTKLKNPHYLPEVAVKVTLVNFMITAQGLQDQLLGIVVAKDKPDLEKKKNKLIIESANNKKMLKEIEDQILEVLSSEGNVLEDESANQILSSSKVLSEEIQEKQKIAVVTEKEIDDARSQYIPVSTHSAVLFFSTSELGNINPMYQYSLTWFINLYNLSIQNATYSDVLEERINHLNCYFTRYIYENVCRSLFEKDKLVFSFILTLEILRSQGKINEDRLSFLLTGGIALDNPFANPAGDWLPDKSWSEIVRASNLEGLEGFKESFENGVSEWKDIYDHANPHLVPFPKPFENAVGLAKLIILRCIRPDKLIPLIQQYIIDNLGRQFIEPPPFNLEESYKDSNSSTPLVFVLSAGSDPMSSLIKFSTENKSNLKSISLGQGQGVLALNLIREALESGGWVVLQNCHVMSSWMPELDKICAELITQPSAHRNFRCWLTSYPSKDFPVSILQNGIKMVNEAPKGLKNNLYRSYTTGLISDDEFYNSCPKREVWCKLLFSLCFFHAIVQERKKFGPLGWNIPYEFNESDLHISLMQLKMFITDYDYIPFEALNYLTGECNYGGRVTDDKDRRLLLTLLSTFYSKEVVTETDYSFSPSAIYKVPQALDRDSVIEYIKQLPLVQNPEVFGLHENADITKDKSESALLLFETLSTQIHIAGGQKKGDSGSGIMDLIDDIMEKLPNEYDVDEVSRVYPVVYMNSMNTVLKQELIRYNRLIAIVKESLHGVHLAVQGLAIMSVELEECLVSMKKGLVPNLWRSKSYPSLKPLGSYVADLILRLQFFQKWIDSGPPITFWFSGFFFTQSFLTGVLQNYSRKYKIPIDQLQIEFYITDFERDATNEPEIGVYSKGLFMEGARWNRKTRLLDESHQKILYDSVPVFWMKPAKKADFDPPPSYFCPVYKTGERRGVLATTGHSSNFVTMINFPTDEPQKHWINRGVACLTQLND